MPDQLLLLDTIHPAAGPNAHKLQLNKKNTCQFAAARGALQSSSAMLHCYLQSRGSVLKRNRKQQWEHWEIA
jgi:hypothetical protein